LRAPPIDGDRELVSLGPRLALLLADPLLDGDPELRKMVEDGALDGFGGDTPRPAR
jgi:hypothetical protein